MIVVLGVLCLVGVIYLSWREYLHWKAMPDDEMLAPEDRKLK